MKKFLAVLLTLFWFWDLRPAEEAARSPLKKVHLRLQQKQKLRLRQMRLKRRATRPLSP